MVKATVSIYLDERRKKTGGACPVKLRVYYNYETRYYSTGLGLTKEDFEQSYLQAKPKGERLKELKTKITSQETKAQQIIEDLNYFSFDLFEKRLLRPSGAGTDAFYYYTKTIQAFLKEERVATASNYQVSLKSLQSFLQSLKKRDTHLPFIALTPSFLKEYEKWMLGHGKSISTVGIYLRPLRALFNEAIAEGEVPKELYPFGKRKYQIPAGRNIKKALKREELKRLLERQQGVDPYMEKARAFWFFSYVCNGMNMKDIAELKYKKISADTLCFVRSKTKNTTRTAQKTILVPLTSFAKEVIERYGNKREDEDSYVFPILRQGMNAVEVLRAVQAFTRFVNQHIKRLAKLADITEDISTYWARHSFTTMAIFNGASLEFVQDSLGHNSITTTMNYWKGFEENAKRELADKLMNF